MANEYFVAPDASKMGREFSVRCSHDLRKTHSLFSTSSFLLAIFLFGLLLVRKSRGLLNCCVAKNSLEPETFANDSCYVK